MATRKVTLSLDSSALSFAETAAAREGLSTSAWLSRVARREALRTGVGPAVDDAAVRAAAETDEAERVAAEEHMRETG